MASKKRLKLDPSRLKYCRKLVDHKVAEAMPLIVDKFAEEAKQGSIEHAHALLKLIGGDPGKLAAKPKRYKFFASELLKGYKKPSAKQTGDDEGGERSTGAR